MPISPMNQIPLLGQTQQRAQASLVQALQSLSLSIYRDLATDHLRQHPDADKATLQEIAKSSQDAAVAFFQALGAMEEQTPPQ